MNRIDTHALPVNLTAHHRRRSLTSREFADCNLAKSPRFSEEALRMDLVIRRHGSDAEDGRFSASARLPLPGRDIHATAVHADLSIAIVKLIETLVRRSHRRKMRVWNKDTTRRVRKSETRHDRPVEISSTHGSPLPGRSPAHVLLAIDYTKPSAAVTRPGTGCCERRWDVRTGSGNSNWRGPVWMPVNYLLYTALFRLYAYYGDDFKVECPTGSGNLMTLYEIARELGERIIRLFEQDGQGRRPSHGAAGRF